MDRKEGRWGWTEYAGAIGVIAIFGAAIIAGVRGLASWVNSTTPKSTRTVDDLVQSKRLNDGDIIRLDDLGPSADEMGEFCTVSLKLASNVTWKKQVHVYQGEELRVVLHAEGKGAESRVWAFKPEATVSATFVKAKSLGDPVPVYIVDLSSLRAGHTYRIVWLQD
jgi:hypothetical protein